MIRGVSFYSGFFFIVLFFRATYLPAIDTGFPPTRRSRRGIEEADVPSITQFTHFTPFLANRRSEFLFADVRG
ncbi:hypothetical protein [Rubripirellula lacrimiformis]|uniref:hypothetical protein n=1 Tax=Rubripirellula lacrimiformis TaxID=1930273 RepID=UPI0011A07F9A|nr:hypothetical protein [Rubripirellula lacrimiformis]